MVAEIALRTLEVREQSATLAVRRELLGEAAPTPGPATLVSKAGHIVATAAAHVEHDLKYDLPKDALTLVKRVKLEMADGVQHVLRISGATKLARSTARSAVAAAELTRSSRTRLLTSWSFVPPDAVHAWAASGPDSAETMSAWRESTGESMISLREPLSVFARGVMNGRARAPELRGELRGCKPGCKAPLYRIFTSTVRHVSKIIA